MTYYALTAVGPDAPGILAALAEPLVELSCNLEDTKATILRGHFTMMMVVRAPEGVEGDTILERVRERCDTLDLRVDLRPLSTAGAAVPASSHVLSVYGADKPGILFRLTQVMAGRGVNMLDLDSRLVGRAGRPVYAMLIEVMLPPGLGEETLRADLEAMGQELAVDVSLRPIEER